MGDASEHSLFSPSSAHKWMRCAGALAMEDGLPNTTNDAAEEGTAAHELAALALTDGVFYTLAYKGRILNKEWEATEEMCEYVQVYVDAIRARVDEYYQAGAVRVTLLIEKRVTFAETIGIPNQSGTSDAIFLVEWADGTALISVEDLKYGYGMVFAQQNEQLMTYALAALEVYGLTANFTRARMVIHQPRRDHVSEWECSVEELEAFAVEAKLAAHKALGILTSTQAVKADTGKKRVDVPIQFLTPGKKQCQWCKRSGDCPALKKWVTEVVSSEFEDLTAANVLTPLEPIPGLSDDTRGEQLAGYLDAMPLLEIFCKGILSAAEAFMFGGGLIPGRKIVAGKKGRRKFRDEKEAEDLLKSMRLKQEEMYDFKLISPTTAEKLLKKDSPRRWKKLSELIVQKEGQPSIAEEADKREAIIIKPASDDFDVVDDDGADLA